MNTTITSVSQRPVIALYPKSMVVVAAICNLGDRQGYMNKGPNKHVIILGKAQELLQFLDAGRGRPVLHRLYFILVHLQFARAHNVSEIFHL